MPVSLLELAKIIDGEVLGDANICPSTLSPITDIQENSLVFADNADKIKTASKSNAAAILAAAGTEANGKALLLSNEPQLAFIKLIKHFYPEESTLPHIHSTAVIAHDAEIGENVHIGPYVVIDNGAKIGANSVLKEQISIGKNVTIGKNCTLFPQVTVYANSSIGNNVCIHSGSIIGADGFGYKPTKDGTHAKVPHVGNVVIEDDVEIGANTVIDRATLGSTIIGEGTKIDNLVQIAHSVKLGRNNIVCAFTGIAGSSTSGDNVIFAANVGVADHVTIGDNVILTARAGVPSKKHLQAGVTYLGSPARPIEKGIEIEISTAKAPMMRKKLKKLSEKVAAIESKLAEEN